MNHRCGSHCLGPLTFHPNAVGEKIRLSEGCRRAERIGDTFKGGVVFSSRPVRTGEKIRVLVQRRVTNWQGAMRVGFTNVGPSARSLPLPPMAMPNLTQTPGHWASPLPESGCREGSVLEFWVSEHGYIYVKFQKTKKQIVQKAVDLRKPLWAMIDVYGQTSSIFLLGSEKKEFLSKRRSCPAPEPLIRPLYSSNADYRALSENSDDSISCLNMEIPAGDGCVVCMVREAEITLPCGHRCLCHRCTNKVLMQFGTCPLCRLEINTPVVTGRWLFGAGWALNLLQEESMQTTGRLPLQAAPSRCVLVQKSKIRGNFSKLKCPDMGEVKPGSIYFFYMQLKLAQIKSFEMLMYLVTYLVFLYCV